MSFLETMNDVAMKRFDTSLLIVTSSPGADSSLEFSLCV